MVLLNNDVQLRPDCLERLVAPLRGDPRVGSVASLMLAPGERAIDSFGVSADITLAGFARLQGRAPDLAEAAVRRDAPARPLAPCSPARRAPPAPTAAPPGSRSGAWTRP